MSTTTLSGVRPRAAASETLWNRVVRTDDSVAPLLARLVLGLVMLPHGLQKVFGMFGGHGFEGTVGFLTGAMGLPWIVAVLVVLIESLGALALIMGALGRLAALGMIAVMGGAVVTSHLANGFFMNWSGQQAGEGFEYHLLVIGLALVVVVAGSGRASLDRLLSR